MGDFTVNMRQKPMDFNRWQLGVEMALLMRHEHLAGSPVELLERAETAPCPNGGLHHPPEAFDRVKVMAAVGGQEMKLQLSIIMRQCGGQFFGPMDTTAIDDHHDLFVGFTKDVHDLVNI